MDDYSIFYKLCLISFLIIVASVISKYFDRNLVLQYLSLICFIFYFYSIIKNKK